MDTIRIGTRASALALAQTGSVAEALRKAHPGHDVQVITISTLGDRVQDVALSRIGDRGLFVKELELALLNGDIDLAVHSAKDLPSLLPEGLALSAFPPRGDARDVLIFAPASGSTGIRALPAAGAILDQVLAQGARVGTSSLRRAAQLRAARPDLRISDVRGNVDTRLRKLAEGGFDALVLAAAGLERLGIATPAADGQPFVIAPPAGANAARAALMAVALPASLLLPAVAQGALALQTRAADARTRALVGVLNDGPTEAAVLAERAFLGRVEGGCQVPVAAYARIEGQRLRIRGQVLSRDGTALAQAMIEGDAGAPEQLGLELAGTILAAGGAPILDDLRTPPAAQPLAGMRVVITRPEGRADALAGRLRQLGAEPVFYPVIAFAQPEDPEAVHVALHALMRGAYDWLVLTSVTAVDAVQTWLTANNLERLPHGRPRLAAVGPVTSAACVTRLGASGVVLPDVFSAGNLAAALGDMRGQRVLLLNADLAGPSLQEQLSTAGGRVERVIAYRTVRAPADAEADGLRAQLAANAIHAITFASPSAIASLAERLGPQVWESFRRSGVLVACIGPATARAATDMGLTPSAVAATATADGLAEALVAAVGGRHIL